MSEVKWRNFINCQVCGKSGAYGFPNNFVCFECWAVDASKRGYTGPINTDPKWLGGHVGRPKQSLFIRPNNDAYMSTRSHLILDIVFVLSMLFTIAMQSAKISELEDRVNTLSTGTVILLRDYLERTK